MKRKATSFLVVMVLVTALAIAAIWTLITPMYQARGEVQIRPIIPRLVFHTDDNGPIPFYESFVNTQVAIMRSPNVLDRVLDQTDVRRTEWYKNPGKSLKQRLTGQANSPMERLKDALSVQPRRSTEIMDVSFSCASAQDAVVIANAVLDQYMRYVEDMTSGQKKEEDRKRDQLYMQLGNEVEVLEYDIRELSQKLGTATPQERISAMRLNLDETEARINELRMTIAVLDAQVSQAGDADGNEVVSAGMHQPPFSQDPEWRGLNENVRTIRHQINASALQPQHPDMIRLAKDLEFAEESVRQREAQLDGQWRNQSGLAGRVGPMAPGTPELAAALLPPEQRLAQAKQELPLLEEQYAKDRKQFDELFAISQDFENRNAALAHKREIFNQVRQIREQKRIESRVAAPIRVLTRAFAPSRPYNDRRIHLTAAVLGLLLVVGVGTAWLGRTPPVERSRNQ